MFWHCGKLLVPLRGGRCAHLGRYLQRRRFGQYYSRTAKFGRTNLLPLTRIEGRQLQTTACKEAKFSYRSQLRYVRRLVVKLGSAVITREDERGIALGRLASIVEQVAECQQEGRECIVVSSGAVTFGKQKLTEEYMKSLSMRETLSPDNKRENAVTLLEARAAAAIGQSGLMSLYEAMFAQYGVKVAQVLVTELDFHNDETRQNLFSTLSELISLNVVPIINTNDAVTPPTTYAYDNRTPGKKKDSNPRLASGWWGVAIATEPPSTRGVRFLDSFIPVIIILICVVRITRYQSIPAFIIARHLYLKIIAIKDNDSLAAMLAAEVQADFLILMSDVDGIYTAPPSQEGSKMLWTFTAGMQNEICFGPKSSKGTGGMISKVNSALYAMDHDISVVICNGNQEKAVKHILAGRKIGTFFTREAVPQTSPVEILAENARNGCRILQSLHPEDRANAINRLADLLISKQDDILRANAMDLAEAKQNGLAKPLLSRLSLTPAKLSSLSTGLKQIAETSHTNVGRVLRNTKLADELYLKQITVPIGVLLVIFESRPDCLPQVASLALSSANGLLLKGGKEAANSNKILMTLVKEALDSIGAAEAIELVSTREEISDLLQLEKHIDLIIPRGSSELVRSIQEQSQHIPVLGHAEGVCHVYVDKEADLQKAIKIVRDSKCDYPAACNAMETLLIHDDLLDGTFFNDICSMLKKEGVHIYSGPRLSEKLTFGPPLAKKLKHEYGALECTVELVAHTKEAIEHINTYGSSHTDVIVTENEEKAKQFQRDVDSACVFHNASSRFADGYRFGLGAEVGISTSRIHARGPVGVEGLLTTKWILFGRGHAAADFAEGGGRQFVHEQLPVS